MNRAQTAKLAVVVQAAVLVISVVYVFLNLAVDIVYVYLDPRIRYE